MEITRAQLAYAAKMNPDGVLRLARKLDCERKGERIEVTARKVADAIERERVAELRERFRLGA